MLNVLIVGCGGFIGAALRYGVSLLINGVYHEAFPLATMLINVVGSFLIGFASVFFVEMMPDRKSLLLFVSTGILGGFTTFSTFSLEAFGLLEQARYGMAGAYMVLSVLSCVLGVFLGCLLAKTVCLH